MGRQVTYLAACLWIVASCDHVAAPGSKMPDAGSAKTIIFAATVKSIDALEREVLTDSAGRVKGIGIYPRAGIRTIVTHFDPRYALLVHVDSASEPDENLEPGTEVVFCIHSPTHQFATSAYQAIGKQYEFKLDISTVDGKPTFLLHHFAEEIGHPPPQDPGPRE